MYAGAIKPGIRSNRHFLFAISNDSKESAVSPEDLGLTRFQFNKAVVPFLLSYRGDAADRKKLQDFLALYSMRQGGHVRTIRAFRLENKPLVFTPNGFKSAPPRITTVYLQDRREDSP